MTRPVKKDAALLKTIGDRLRKARTAKGLTQEQLAEAVGVQPETISRYERGTIPLSLTQLFEVAAALDVGVEALLGLGGRKGREADLLDRFRLLDRRGQELFLDLLRRMVP